jgi:hypothetical protein
MKPAKTKNEEFSVTIQKWCHMTPIELFTPSKAVADHTTPGCVSMSYRKLLQLWGTEYRRKQDPDYWVKRLESKLAGLEKAVIDDVRFPNEVELIKRLGGKVIRIDRPQLAESSHESELILDDFDGWDDVIVNDGTLGELKEKVWRIKQ